LSLHERSSVVLEGNGAKVADSSERAGVRILRDTEQGVANVE
jgi:hypothetical protein